jgi:hypothetical protein
VYNQKGRANFLPIYKPVNPVTLSCSTSDPAIRRVLIRHQAESYHLTDGEWNLISDLFPLQGRGPFLRNHRQVADGVLLVARGCCTRWRDLPACYGPWQTVYWRYRRYEEDGTLANMLARLSYSDEGSEDF